MTPEFTLAELTLLRPLWLLALPLLGLVAWRTPQTPRPSAWDAVVDDHLRPHVLVAATTAPRRPARLAAALALTLVILALAGPALPGRAGLAFRDDAVRAVLIDLSGEGDTAALRLKLLALLQQLPAGQTALIAYADEPYLVAPPTTDAATLRLLAPDLAPEIMPVPGQRPDHALRLAQAVLDRSGAARRDILWLSASPAASAASVSALADLARQGIRVNVLHAQPSLPPDMLDAVRRSGGSALPLRPDNTDLQELIAVWTAQHALAPSGRTTEGHRELGPWLLALALPLAAFALRSGVLFVLLLLPALQAPGTAHAADTDARWLAVEHYRAGRYAEAAATLEPFDDADSLYNRGTALARLQRLPEALAILDAALALRPDDQDIRHNRDLVRALLNPPPDPTPPPPAPAPPPPAPPNNAPQQEADQLAQQWLRRLPDDPAGLLRQKLRLEHERRLRGEGDRSWQ